jgi:glutamate--cysteine ligase
MPTTAHTSALNLDAAREQIATAAFGTKGGEPPIGCVGLEPEIFPIRVDGAGRPTGRVRLAPPDGVVHILDGIAGRESWIGARDDAAGAPVYPLGSGGRITFEPGAQIEHSSAVHRTAAGALEEVERVVAGLRKAFDAHRVVLASAGLDLWHELDTVPQQLVASRYQAMANYFDRRGRYGRVMMRHTASMQVNLDLGPGMVARERWLLSNLVSPLVTATFAASPAAGAVSARAQAWQGLDPTRTGFPATLVDGSRTDPSEVYADAALSADLMLFWTAPGAAEPGEPGFSFERWIREGHPRYGWPTPKDLEYHLTTLFFEVRPRGFLELRAPEALPDLWRPVSVVLLAGLLYDAAARAEGLALLEDTRGRLPKLWYAAAHTGLRDEELGPLAPRTWEIALDGARRLPEGFLRERDLELTERFLERFTFRGQMPADELSEMLELGSAASLQWAVGGSTERIGR